MANQWLRLWHDMPNDPKWKTIARASKQPITAVLSVYLHILVNASANATERGRTQSLVIEDIASALDLEDEQVQAILNAMEGRVLEGDRVSGWEKRQPAREDGSAGRAKAWRAAKKQAEMQSSNASYEQPNATERGRTLSNAPDTDTDTDKEINHNPANAGLPGIVDSLPGAEQEKPAVPVCPHQEIIALYHELLPTGTQVRVWNDTRAKHLQARWREDPKRQSLDWWRRFFGYVAQSEFLTGQASPAPGRDPFVVSLDWLISPQNFARTVEGKYHRSAA